MQEDTAPGARESVVIKERHGKANNVGERGLDLRRRAAVRGEHRIRLAMFPCLPRRIWLSFAITRKPKWHSLRRETNFATGETRGPGGIVASSTTDAGDDTELGGDAVDMGILRDRPEELFASPEPLDDADSIRSQAAPRSESTRPVQSALGPLGFTLDFWKIQCGQ